MKEKKMEKYEHETEKEMHPKIRMHSRKNEVSIPADGTNVLPKERVRHAPPEIGRHEKFQFGTNPMAMTPFEKGLVEKEKEERRIARDYYIAGTQGRDGGRFPEQQFENQWPDKF